MKAAGQCRSGQPMLQMTGSAMLDTPGRFFLVAIECLERELFHSNTGASNGFISERSPSAGRCVSPPFMTGRCAAAGEHSRGGGQRGASPAAPGARATAGTRSRRQ